ncbi:hypothetical protein QQ020_27850 [Fulvivirgaceae bacterium BMA12]|uniref:Uncharacterized protein n=1 Tax=Agaribacillus aureus TaxID=3051825 RepID=A0ABT8LDR9_9BACT|nr:hypothetical protein [Fulvivirgaceae bacterium BMA12]
MLRFAFIFIVFVHGLIHLLGFAKEWNLMPLSQLSGKTLLPLNENLSKFFGTLWLLSFLALVAAGLAFLWKKEWWTHLALISIIISQLLIVLYWPDAKVGTIANVIILVAIILSFTHRQFERETKYEVQNLLADGTESERSVITMDMLETLPGPVQKWLKNAGVIGKNHIRQIYLEQNGKIRSKEGSAWLPVVARQFFTTEVPGFIWNVEGKQGSIFKVVGRDKYRHGKGHMLIKMFSMIPIVSEEGKEVNQGAMLRYLAETVWFPTMALSQYISWEGIDANSARATFIYRDLSVSGVFVFDDEGNVSAFKAQRYYYREKDEYSLESWSVSMSNYQQPAGIRIPMAGTVSWKLETGEFIYYQMEITDIEYDEPLSAVR